MIWMGQAATLYYFAHFLVVLPLVGKLETPKEVPTSISQAVTAKGAVAHA